MNCMNKNLLMMTWHFCLPCKYVPTDVCTAETADAWAATVSLHLPTLFCLHRLHSPDSCSKGTFHKSKYHYLSENAIKNFRITTSDTSAQQNTNFEKFHTESHTKLQCKAKCQTIPCSNFYHATLLQGC